MGVEMRSYSLSPLPPVSRCSSSQSCLSRSLLLLPAQLPCTPMCDSRSVTTSGCCESMLNDSLYFAVDEPRGTEVEEAVVVLSR